jgi:hypothetical protein
MYYVTKAASASAVVNVHTSLEEVYGADKTENNDMRERNEDFQSPRNYFD